MPAFKDGNVAEYGSSLPAALSGQAQVIATAGTVLVNADVVRLNPAGAVTGVIMPAGPKNTPQTVVLVNESANTITFDVVATSRVADGATSAIPALASRVMVWDPVTQLWYRAA